MKATKKALALILALAMLAGTISAMATGAPNDPSLVITTVMENGAVAVTGADFAAESNISFRAFYTAPGGRLDLSDYDYIDQYRTDAAGGFQASYATSKEFQIGGTVTVVVAGGGLAAPLQAEATILPTLPTVAVTNTRARPGGEFSVDVVLYNNPGIASMRLFLEFDDELFTLESVEDAGVLGGAFHYEFEESPASPYTLYWETDSTQNVTANGAVAKLNFTASESTRVAPYVIGVSYDELDIVNSDEKAVDFRVASGGVNVIIVYGNVSGTLDDPSSADSVLLTRYLANWPGIVIFKPAADVDLDTRITPRDSLILRRHLAKWDNYLTLPIPLIQN